MRGLFCWAAAITGEADAGHRAKRGNKWNHWTTFSKGKKRL